MAVCAGSDIMHSIGSLFVGLIAGWLFVKVFTLLQRTQKIDDVLGVWPLHGLCGTWGGIATGIFGLEALGGFMIYASISKILGLRLTQEQEFQGADLSIHNIGSINHD